MSKWLDKLTLGKSIDYQHVLEEREAIIQYDGKEPESEYSAVLLFINDNRERLQRHIISINGESYLKLKEIL
ncbi:MAG: hypothetical protein LBB21_06645 [Holosporaceae bacterium]|jgi:hypothetical protein|nr:hypothetical protein [Holosporaceae bacterium]